MIPIPIKTVQSPPFPNHLPSETQLPIELETTIFDTAIQPYTHTPIPPDNEATKGELTDGEPITNTPYHVNETYSEGGGGGEGGEMRAHESEIEEREGRNGFEIDAEGGEDPTKCSALQKQADESQGKDVYHTPLTRIIF